MSILRPVVGCEVPPKKRIRPFTSCDTCGMTHPPGRRLALLCAALLLAGAHPLPAQEARDTVAAQLRVVAEAKADDAFAPDPAPLGRPVLLGVLEHETSVYLEVTLEAGRDYFIAARCDTGCANLDTRLLAPDYSPVAEDTLDNDAPQMLVTVPAAGPHLLALQMASCTARICYFGVTILSRPAR